MMATLTYVCLWITVVITGYIALMFLRDPEAAMVQATHRLELLPKVMAGRYVVVFLFSIGVLSFGTPEMIVYFFGVCTFMGLFDGWVYARRGLPHFKHTATGLLSLGAMCVSTLSLFGTGAKPL